MTQKTNRITPLHRSTGKNGPSTGLGVPVMVIGIITFIAGLANLVVAAILCGFLLLLLAAYLILSVDCIAIDKISKELYLYKDYFIFKQTNKFRRASYSKSLTR